MVEVIVRYNGDIDLLAQRLGASVEVLGNGYAIVEIKSERLNSLAMSTEIEYIEAPKKLTYLLDRALRSSCVYESEQMSLSGEGVLIGIIDSGIDIFHPDFTDEEGNSRIEYIWDQSLTSGTPPEGFKKGTLFNNAQINEALSKGEFEHQDILGHGTQVAGVAAGNGRASDGRYKGVAPESRIIAVKLGSGIRDSFARDTDVLRAIRFILNVAVERNMPVAINISYGTNDGAHNGQSLFETYLNEMSLYHKNSIVVAMGNEGVSGHHYKGRVRNGEKQEIEFNLSGTQQNVGFGLWKNYVDKMSVELISPSGEASGIVAVENGISRSVLAGVDVEISLSQPTPYISEQEIYFSLDGEIPEGIWRINVFGDEIIEGSFDIWLPIAEIITENSFFLSPSTDNTLTLPATAKGVISVGGYNSDLDTFSEFSGRGNTIYPEVIKPDLVAPANDIVAPSVGGGYTAASGTSIAAPFVTGVVALLMEWGIVKGNDSFLYGERMKAYLRSGARRKADIEYPNHQWGYGELCLKGTLDALNKNENNISIMQNENIRQFIIEYNDEIGRYVEMSEDISLCRTVNTKYAVAFVREGAIERLNEEELFKNRFVTDEPFLLGLMDYSALEASEILQVKNSPTLGLRGNGVLIGIIDTGIDYLDSAFIYEDNSSKIQYLWDQGLEGDNSLCFGREFTNEQLGQAIRAENPLEIVPSVDSIGHGTSLARIAAGREDEKEGFSSAAPNSDLIVVKLREADEQIRRLKLVGNDKNAYNSADIILAVDYIIRKAIELQRPVSICIGLGTNEGGHSGSSLFEDYLSEVATKNGVCLTVPMGNECIARHHTELVFEENEEFREVEINVDEAENGFQVLVWSLITERNSVEIISPLGEAVERIQPVSGLSLSTRLNLTGSTVTVEYYLPVRAGNDNLAVIKIENPLQGIWKIRVYPERVVTGKVEMWLPITDFLNGSTYFLNSTVDTTLTVPASARTVLAVGGYNDDDNSIFNQSGRGPTRFERLAPVICAPAVRVWDGKRYISGTSAGAALAVGAAALILEWGAVRNNQPIISTRTIIGYLISGAENPGEEILPNNTWGFGIMKLYKSFEAM